MLSKDLDVCVCVCMESTETTAERTFQKKNKLKDEDDNRMVGFKFSNIFHTTTTIEIKTKEQQQHHPKNKQQQLTNNKLKKFGEN